MTNNRSTSTDWPDISYGQWKDTLATLHMWMQIAGKIRLARTPWTNHSWHVPLYITGRGLTTSLIPFDGRGLELEFDFREHTFNLLPTDAAPRAIELKPRSVADFYANVMDALAALRFDVSIHTTPSEVADGIAFDEDETHTSYDADAAQRFWQALVQMDRVFKQVRARFIGKCSPVHFFWGSFDLAVTRFSGREAPPHPGGVPNFPDWVAKEAYSHEVSSAGFWPGGDAHPHPIFYSYAYPAPDGFEDAPLQPEEAQFVSALGAYVLPYDAVRNADSPDDALLAFLQSTYEAAADNANWDRNALERDFTRSARAAV